MKIVRIEVYHLKIKLKKPFVISLGRMDYADNIIVVIRTDTGITGFGECSPFMTINGENHETAFVVARYTGRILLGQNPADIAGCSRLMDSVIHGNTSIKSAFDIALYDIASQEAGVPLFAYLGGVDSRVLVTDFTVSLGTPENMAADALRIKEDGYPVIKVKLGGSVQEDITRVRLIRDSVGSIIPLRLDANQGWDPISARRILNVFSDMNVQFCEEPIPRWDFMALPGLRADSPVPVMADESCLDHHDAQRLIDINACDYINVKLGKSSGIFKALKIAGIAGEAGIKMQVGGFLESKIGFTASAHLALATENVVFCDFDSPLLFCDDPVKGGISYLPGGVVRVPHVPGLGASVDQNYLDKLEKIIIA